MPQLPFLEVDHLTSSSSFYSAVLRPLGLRYLNTERGHFPSVTFGNSPRDPVFQVRQVVASRDRPLKCSHIVLSAPSAVAADEAYEFALRANPDPQDEYLRHPSEAYPPASGVSARRTGTNSGGTRVVITDVDGNIMEIIYQVPTDYPPHYNGSTVRHTRSTSEEASRILFWNFDVAGSSRPPPPGAVSTYSGPPRADSRRALDYYPEDNVQAYPPELKRSATTSSSNYEPAPSARENSAGLSAGAVVGTLLGVAGVAAGAAFTYNMFRGDRSRSSHQDYDAPPSFSRRSTFPEKYDPYSERKGRYSDFDRSVDKSRYSDEYIPTSDYRRPAPDYIARYSHADGSRRREPDDFYEDTRGRSAPRSRISTRPRSESANDREAYLLADGEHRSYSSSKSARHPPIVQRSYTYDTPDQNTSHSARSQRSSSTLRAPPADPFVTTLSPISHSRTGSRATTTTYKVSDSPRAYSREGSYLSARHLPLPDNRTPTYLTSRDVPLSHGRAPPYLSGREDAPSHSRANTYYSTRDMALPRSGMGGSHARYEDDDYDDADSIAPSDSISCVGSRRSR
ncbi:hypothetical protein QBC35DRAFT_19419 [Podospora australis]|uniref:Uncharacterized protein n=1 Tax=Podospora australis TaxID=1536484 RepID=A0AAN6WRV5_9PEZI|nr:hypothetical protein QBC35DRAFT_19419 [Podospora australis]